MEIKNIVLHQIIREENDLPVLNCADHLLAIEDETVIEFVVKLIKNFSFKNPTYGKFQEDSSAYPFQNLVSNYFISGDFLNFSIDAMKLLAKEIQVPKAKGGYVVFTHYTQNGIDYLITMMLDKSEQFVIDDNSLDLIKLLTLDIDRLARANRINIKKWQDDAEQYLSFIKGTRTVSEYYQKFIGNTDLTSSTINARNLKYALNAYMRDNDFSDEKKDSVHRNLENYIKGRFENDQDVQLAAVSAHVDPDNSERFMKFIQEDDDIHVSGSFRITKKSDFDIFHKSVVSGIGFKLIFEQNLVKQGKIIRVGNDLIIKNIPEEILDKEISW